MYTKAARLARRSAWHIPPILHILHAARMRPMPMDSTEGHVAEPSHRFCQGVQYAELGLPSALGRPPKIRVDQDRVKSMLVAILVMQKSLSAQSLRIVRLTPG